LRLNDIMKRGDSPTEHGDCPSSCGDSPWLVALVNGAREFWYNLLAGEIMSWFQMKVVASMLMAVSATVVAADETACVMRPADVHSPALRRLTCVPSLAVSPKNERIWATYYGGVTPDEDSNAYIVLSTSADRGRSWEDVLIVESGNHRRVFDPELWVAPDGKLRWTLTSRRCSNKPAGSLSPYRGNRDNLSDDRLLMAELDAENEPSDIPSMRQIADGVMMCKPLALKDGTWLFPVSRWYQEPSACFFASTNGGRTFAYRGGVSHFPKENRCFDEHTVIERSDGSLLTFLRAKKDPTCLESVSTDGGKSWTVGTKARFEHVSSRHFLRRLKSGNLLLVKNGPLDRNVGRSQMTAFLSDNDGETWKGGLLLDERSYTSYPDGDQAADGTIYVIYDHDRLVTQEILFAAFTEEEVLAGKFLRPDSVRKGSVVRHPTGSAVAGRTLDLGPHVVARRDDYPLYEALNPHFGKAFAFLCRKDLKNLKPGRYEIDGTNCWAMVQEVKLTPIAADERAEVHHAYIDLQMPLTDEETYGICTADARHRPEKFDTAKDIGYFRAPVRPLTIGPNRCAIFFPWDGAHAPNRCEGKSRTIRKVVVKVRAE